MHATPEMEALLGKLALLNPVAVAVAQLLHHIAEFAVHAEVTPLAVQALTKDVEQLGRAHRQTGTFPMADFDAAVPLIQELNSTVQALAAKQGIGKAGIAKVIGLQVDLPDPTTHHHPAPELKQ